MNYRDFELARKKERTRLSHLAIIRKLIKDRQSRPRCEKNILSNDPRLQRIQHFHKKVVDKQYKDAILINISNKRIIDFCFIVLGRGVYQSVELG